MNGISFVLMTLYLFFNPWSSELGDGMRFIQSHPSVLSDIFIFALTGSLGQLFIFYMLQRFGSLSLVTVTVTRKMFSILLSVFLFGHAINIWQWMAVSVVFMGIGLEAYYSRKEKLEKLQALKKQEDTVYSETQGLLKDEIKSNTPDLDNKLGSPRRSPRKSSPKRQVNSPEKVNQADKLADRGLEHIFEASGSNRRRSARLQSRN